MELPTADEVRSIIREEVRAALRDLAPANRGPLSIVDAARELGVSTRTLRRKVKAGEIPVVRIGRRVLIDPGALRPTPMKVARLAHDALTR